MITINSKINSYPSYPIEKPFTLNDIVFFDIETTGFSAKTSYLYLIGCMYYKENTWQITQWLADDMISEANLLKEFFQFIMPFKRLIHFNGSGFDIPYILQKSKQHQLEAPFDNLESFDLYRKVLPFRKILPLNNYKLKTLESFLGFNRSDPYSGEELIQIYANYLGRKQYEKLHQKTISNNNAQIKDEAPNYTKRNKTIVGSNESHLNIVSAAELQNSLLLHNLEDIKGLLTIADVLFYTDLFTKDLDALISNPPEPSLEYVIVNEKNTNHSLPTICKIQLNLCFANPKQLAFSTPLPTLHSLEKSNKKEFCDDNDNYNADTDFNNIKLLVNKDQLTLYIPLYNGELKFFYDNYRDYYYLPKEDTAIHKSVGEYVDKEFKVKAKPATCYNKKSGNFLPQTDFIYTPFFKHNYADKLSFFEIKKGLESDANFNTYVHSLIQFIFQNKETKVTLNVK